MGGARISRFGAWIGFAVCIWAECAGTSHAASIKLVLEPTSTVCLSAKTLCANAARISPGLEYKLVFKRASYLRVKISQRYERSQEDGADVETGDVQISPFFPVESVLDFKARINDVDARDRLELRTGYSYRRSTATMPNNGYHSIYVSGDYFFGLPISAGSDGLSRQFDMRIRLAQNKYAERTQPNQLVVQLAPGFTVPVNKSGSTRITTTYLREIRFNGSDPRPEPSNRFDLSAIRDMNPAVRAYVTYSLFAAHGSPGKGQLVFGVRVKFF